MTGVAAPIVLAVSLALAAAQPGAGTLVIEHVTVVDGSPSADRTVVIDKGAISDVGASASTRVPQGAQRIDGHGEFLIPGLWDMHVHLTNTTEVACPVMIANGVTAVRDMGGELEVVDWMRDRIDRGALIGPAIYRAGPFVDGLKPGVPDRLVVSSEADGRAAARLLKRRGVDYIKTHTATPREAYFALVDEARVLGLHVVGHVPFDVTPEEAIDAGQHSIEHVVSLLEGPLTKLVRETGVSQGEAFARFTDAYFSELSDRMVKHGTWFDPTLIAYWSRANQWDLAGDPRMRYITKSGREFWKVFADLPDTPDMRATQRRVFARFVDIVRIAKQRGVRFLVGTDVSVKHVYPGFSVHDELRLLVDAGLTPREALLAATRNAAESLGVQGTVGAIEAGKRADLVLLDGDPLADIRNTTAIRGVVSNGRFFDREKLDAMLAKAAADAPQR
jgi:imidazolonepropionase-like amidohydrolase